MKYGLLVFKDTDNIGDDIQSYATERFLPQIDYFIDRESLNTFQPDSNEKVALIMNAWYMHNKYIWPPSAYILPCFLSVHITPKDFFMIGDDFYSPYTIEYLKKYEPIGVRDSDTLRNMQLHGINSFFSGCMTLTIEADGNVQKEKTICCVDVDNEIIDEIKKRAPSCPVKVITHNVINNEEFYWEKRKNNVKKLLGQYQRAQCVITTRLHCALPCLALETPVLLLYNNNADFKNRMEDYLPLLHHCSKRKFLEDNIYDVTNPPLNKRLHIELKEKLIQQVQSFLEKTKRLKTQADIPENYWYNQLLQQSELLKKQLPKLKEKHDRAWEIEQAKNYYESQIECKDSRINELELWIKELEKNKSYLEEQIAFKDSRITELESWTKQLEDAKEYLDKQINFKNSRIAELESWTLQLEDAKEYLQNQVGFKNLRIEELESWIKELDEAKKYLEDQVAMK